MDRKTTIGVILIMILLYIFTLMNGPSQEELDAAKFKRDSIALVKKQAEEAAKAPETNIATSQMTTLSDSQRVALASQQYGDFGANGVGQEQNYTLENDLFTVHFSNKGGRINKVVLKKYDKLTEDKDHVDHKSPVELFEDQKDRFEYIIPTSGVPGGKISTKDLFFNAETTNNSISFSATTAQGQAIKLVYSLLGDYRIGHQLLLDNVPVTNNAGGIQLFWESYLDKIEKNTGFEKYYSTVYYKEVDEGTDYCSCRSSDKDDLSDKPLKWVSHSNQFFNTTLIADSQFDAGVMETVMLDEEDDDMKRLVSTLNLGTPVGPSSNFDMVIYSGPNEFERLENMGYDLEDIIPYGRSIFGTINRRIIRPLFSVLYKWVGSMGIAILLLTLLVKLLLYPMTYRMLKSQAKMSALKPVLAGIKEKYGDDQQKSQMETMKVYREYGVNPAGGCLPMVLQMPIWFALYRFFPASIDFRQSSFLWAPDLSSFDAFFQLPFEIPLIGSHLSMFTILYTISMLLYTYYNSKMMDMSAAAGNSEMAKMMKYMQYIMPVMFFFFFNNYAAGLTLYLLFSNILNITQTLVTKNVILDNDKILDKLEQNKAKPKKRSKFSQRLETAMQESQRMAEERKSGNSTSAPNSKSGGAKKSKFQQRLEKAMEEQQRRQQQKAKQKKGKK